MQDTDWSNLVTMEAGFRCPKDFKLTQGEVITINFLIGTVVDEKGDKIAQLNLIVLTINKILKS